MPSPSPTSGLLDQISVGPPTSSLPREMIDESIAEHGEAEGSREVVFVVTDLDVELEARAPMSGGWWAPGVRRRTGSLRPGRSRWPGR